MAAGTVKMAKRRSGRTGKIVAFFPQIKASINTLKSERGVRLNLIVLEAISPRRSWNAEHREGPHSEKLHSPVLNSGVSKSL